MERQVKKEIITTYSNCDMNEVRYIEIWNLPGRVGGRLRWVG